MFLQTAHASTISLPQAATFAARVDHLHDFLWWMSLFFLALVTFGMIYLVKKYFNDEQFSSFIHIKFFNQIFANGGFAKTFFKAVYLIARWPVLKKAYVANKVQAMAHLSAK